MARPPLRPAAFFCAVVPPWRESPRSRTLAASARGAGRVGDPRRPFLGHPLVLQCLVCFSFFTLGRLSGIAPPSSLAPSLVPALASAKQDEALRQTRRRAHSPGWPPSSTTRPSPRELEAFAALLDLAETSRYTSRAYRRAAATIRETSAPIAELVRDGPRAELRGIGPGIAARLHELVETGTIAELEALEARRGRSSSASGRLLGIAPQRMIEIAAALGVETADDFAESPARARCRTVPGIGPSTERKMLARLEPTRRGRDAA